WVHSSKRVCRAAPYHHPAHHQAPESDQEALHRPRHGVARAWSVLGGVFFLTALVTGHEILWQPLVIGLVAITSTYYVVRRHRTTWLLGLPLLMALLYGILYVGVNRVLIAEPEMRLVQSASKIAAAIEEFLPIVCEHGVDIPACFVISRSI